MVSERYIPLRAEPNVTVENVLDLQLRASDCNTFRPCTNWIVFCQSLVGAWLEAPLVICAKSTALPKVFWRSHRQTSCQPFLLPFAKQCFQETLLSPLLSCQIFCLHMCSGHKLASNSPTICHYPIESHEEWVNPNKLWRLKNPFEWVNPIKSH